MADIEIRKKRRSLWPWVIAVLIFIAVVWLVTGLLGTREERVPGAPLSAPPADTPATPTPPKQVPPVR